MNIYGIVAVAQNGVIGNQGRLPWQGYLPNDMRRFRELTFGHTVLMGRATFESIGRPLDGRTNIVLSRDPDYQAAGALGASSVENALKYLADDIVFVIGGAQIYQLAEPLITRWYLTVVHYDFEGDTHLPRRFYDPVEEGWHMSAQEDYLFPPGSSQYSHSFYVKERNPE